MKVGATEDVSLAKLHTGQIGGLELQRQGGKPDESIAEYLVFCHAILEIRYRFNGTPFPMAGVIGKLPAHLQLRVLSMLDDQNFQAVTGISPPEEAASVTTDKSFLQESGLRFTADHALQSLKDRGFAVYDSFLGPDAAAGLLENARTVFHDGRMRKAGMGRGNSAWTDVRARGDSMVWLNEIFSASWAGAADSSSTRASNETSQQSRCVPSPTAFTIASPQARNTSPVQKLSVENMRRAATEFSIPDTPQTDPEEQSSKEEPHWIKEASLALNDVKTQIAGAAGPDFTLSKATFQLARYSGGARYVKHKDVSDRCPDRRLTCIYYFNDGWKEEYGGALRLHLSSGMVDVAPLADRLVLFLPDIEHEVLPSYHERFALSGWMYGPNNLFPTDGRPTASKTTAGPPTKTNTASFGPAITPAASTQASPEFDAEERRAGAAVGRRNVKALTIATDDPRRESIFVSVAAYRDPEAQHTLRDLFAKAACPARVYVGLVSQVDVKEDAACFEHSVPMELRGNVAEVRVHWSEARGPCWARHLAQRLWSGQKYYLQIDSHMRFIQDWDAILIDQLKLCPSPKPVLSTYPAGYERGQETPSVGPPTVLAATEFGKEGMLRIAGRIVRSKPDSPQPGLFWAAGFSFSSSSVLKDVPYDPSLKFLFFGEEMTMLARMWTRGYDIYTPTTSVAFHLWSRDYRHTFSCDVKDRYQLHLRSLHRARFILGSRDNTTAESAPEEAREASGQDETSRSHRPMHLNCCALLSLLSQRNAGADDAAEAKSDPTRGAAVGELYGLGTERTVESFYEHVGVNFLTATIDERAKRGGMAAENLL